MQSLRRSVVQIYNKTPARRVLQGVEIRSRIASHCRGNKPIGSKHRQPLNQQKYCFNNTTDANRQKVYYSICFAYILYIGTGAVSVSEVSI